MSKPALRAHSTPTWGDLQPDSSGFLHDAAMRRSLSQMEGRGSVEVLETLGALRLAAKQIHDAMERFAEAQGLSESRLRVLMRLYHSPSRQLPLGVLAEVLNVTPRTMTDIVDVLERDGMVKRVPDPVDRRSILAAITDSGLARIKAMRKEAVAAQAAVAQGFSTANVVQRRHMCMMMWRNICEEDA